MCVERVLVGLFLVYVFALSRVIFIGVNLLLGRPTKRLNECSLLFGGNLRKIYKLPKYLKKHGHLVHKCLR